MFVLKPFGIQIISHGAIKHSKCERSFLFVIALRVREQEREACEAVEHMPLMNQIRGRGYFSYKFTKLGTIRSYIKKIYSMEHDCSRFNTFFTVKLYWITKCPTTCYLSTFFFSLLKKLVEEKEIEVAKLILNHVLIDFHQFYLYL